MSRGVISLIAVLVVGLRRRIVVMCMCCFSFLVLVLSGRLDR